MVHLDLNDYDHAYMYAIGISTVEDTRSREEVAARFVVPEWLRRAMWHQFWVDQDALTVRSDRYSDIEHDSYARGGDAAHGLQAERRRARPGAGDRADPVRAKAVGTELILREEGRACASVHLSGNANLAGIVFLTILFGWLCWGIYILCG